MLNITSVFDEGAGLEISVDFEASMDKSGEVFVEIGEIRDFNGNPVPSDSGIDMNRLEEALVKQVEDKFMVELRLDYAKARADAEIERALERLADRTQYCYP